METYLYFGLLRKFADPYVKLSDDVYFPVNDSYYRVTGQPEIHIVHQYNGNEPPKPFLYTQGVSNDKLATNEAGDIFTLGKDRYSVTVYDSTTGSKSGSFPVNPDNVMNQDTITVKNSAGEENTVMSDAEIKDMVCGPDGDLFIIKYVVHSGCQNVDQSSIRW